MCQCLPAVSFSYASTGPDEVVMMMTRTGSKVITKFEASAVKVTPNQMRWFHTLNAIFLHEIAFSVQK